MLQERAGRPHRGLGAGHVGGREAQRVCCPGSLRRRLDSRGREQGPRDPQQQRRRRRRRERRRAAGAGGPGAVAVSTAAGSGHRGTRQRREAVRGAAELEQWFGPGVVSRVPGDVRAGAERRAAGLPGVPGPRGGGQRPARLGHGRFRGRLLAHADARTWPSGRRKAGRPLLVQRGRREHVRSPGRDPPRLDSGPGVAPEAQTFTAALPVGVLQGPRPALRTDPRWPSSQKRPALVPGVRPRRPSPASVPGVGLRCPHAQMLLGPRPPQPGASERGGAGRHFPLENPARGPVAHPSDTYAAPSPALRPREKPRQRRRGQQITPLSSETAPVSPT